MAELNYSNTPTALITMARATERAKAKGVPLSRRTLLRLVHEHDAGVRLGGRILVDERQLERILAGEPLARATAA